MATVLVLSRLLFAAIPAVPRLVVNSGSLPVEAYVPARCKSDLPSLLIQ